MSAQSITRPSDCLILFKQSLITVKAVSARKSIFSIPVFSKSDMEYCVVNSSLDETATGISSRSGVGEITTPAACTEACLAQPSRRFAKSINSLTCGLLSTAERNSDTCSSACAILTLRPLMGGGINLAILSTSA